MEATGKEMAGLPGRRGEHPIPGGKELEGFWVKVVWVIAAGGESVGIDLTYGPSGGGARRYP